MKINEKELRRIISEERDRLLSEQNDTLQEGYKEMEMELIEDLVDMLIERGAIRLAGPDDDGYRAAYEYLNSAVMPALKGFGR